MNRRDLTWATFFEGLARIAFRAAVLFVVFVAAWYIFVFVVLGLTPHW